MSRARAETNTSFEGGCPPVPELLERLTVRPEHDSRRYTPHMPARHPVGLPNSSGHTGGFAPAIKKYRAHLKQHPDDAAAWEGLAYLHLRIASGEGKGTNLGAEGLVTRQESDDPLRAGHQLLSFQYELQALLREPDNLRFRGSLNTTLALALTDAQRENPYHRGHYVAIVRCLGGVGAARDLRYAIVEGTLDLRGRRPDLTDPLQEAELVCDLADLHRDRGEHREALAMYARALGLVHAAQAAGQRVYLRGPSTLLLWMHLSAVDLGDLAAAERYLDGMEEAEREEDEVTRTEGEVPVFRGPASRLRLRLLEAQGRGQEAHELAVREADMHLERFRQSGDDWALFERANLLDYAGQHEQARTLLERIVAGKESRWSAHGPAREALERIARGERLVV